jgi:hypothetical protein
MGVQKTVKANIYKLTKSYTDTTTSTRYNGLVVSEARVMADLQQRDNPYPVHVFNVSVNGRNIGTVFYDAYAFISRKEGSLTFNDIQVVEESSPGTVPLELFAVK